MGIRLVDPISKFSRARWTTLFRYDTSEQYRLALQRNTHHQNLLHRLRVLRGHLRLERLRALEIHQAVAEVERRQIEQRVEHHGCERGPSDLAGQHSVRWIHRELEVAVPRVGVVPHTVDEERGAALRVVARRLGVVRFARGNRSSGLFVFFFFDAGNADPLREPVAGPGEEAPREPLGEQRVVRIVPGVEMKERM